MKNRMTNEEKILKINNDRKILLESVRDDIKNNAVITSNKINEIVKILEFDEKNIKKYKAIVSAKETILQLMEEIALSETKEDVEKIRTKINYYINKIKKEMKNRNISKEHFNELYSKTAVLRKDISRYIRYIKRQSNISRIIELNSNSKISIEDSEELKRLFNNEIRYNKIQLALKKESNIKDEEVLTDIDVEEIEEDININVNKDLNTNLNETIEEITDIYFDQEKEQNTDAMFDNSDIENDSNGYKIQSVYYDAGVDSDIKDDFSKQLSYDSRPGTICIQLNKKSELYYAIYGVEPDEDINIDDVSIKLDDIEKKIFEYQRKYRIREPLEYNGSIVRNISTLFKNLKTYNKNQRRVQRMEKDYNKNYGYYGGNGKDLKMCIEYTKENNLFNNALKNIFRSTFLNEKEKECLNNHEKCMKWISQYNSKNTEHENIQYVKTL